MKIKSLLVITLLFAFGQGLWAQDLSQFNQNFESNSLNGWNWAKWDEEKFNGNCFITSSYPYEGSYCFQNEFNNAYLVSPQLPITNNGVYVTFYYTNCWAGSSKFQVGYSTKQDFDIDDFQWFEEVFVNKGTVLGPVSNHTGDPGWGEPYEYGFPIGARYFAIRFVAGNHALLDDITFTEPECAIPSMPEIDVLTDNFIRCSWQGNNESYQLNYVTLATTGYYGYEVGMEGWSSDAWVWSEDPDAPVSDFIGHDGSDNCVFSYLEDNDVDTYLISPKMSLDGSLSFYATSCYIASDGGQIVHDKIANNRGIEAAEFEVLVCVTDGNTPNPNDFVSLNPTATFVAPLSYYDNNEWNWSSYSIDLSSYNGALGYVAIRHIYVPEGEPYEEIEYLLIDDVTVKQVTPHVINNITETSYSIEGLNPEAECTIQVKGICGANEALSPMLYAQTYPVGTCSKRIVGYSSEKDHYYLIASPVGNTTPSTANGFLANAYDLYYFDQNETLEWRNYEDASFNLVPGKGYLYANSEDVTLSFTYNGTPTANVTLVKNNDSQFPGMNLVGNPFSQKAYLGSRDFYVMNSDGDEIISADRNYVEPMEGAFVVAQEDQEEMTFSTTASRTSNGSLALNVSRSRGNVIDRAAVRFGQGHGMEKFQLNPNHTKVYFPMGGKDYAVACVDGTLGEMPVNFKAEENGIYTISVEPDMVDVNYMHLIDNLTGANINLLVDQNYTFEAKTTDYASRFKLMFATSSSVTDDSFGFINNGNLIVLGIEGEATLQVIDMTGRMISSEPFSGTYEKQLNVAPGVYMIRLISGDSVKVQKIIIK